MSMSKVIWTNFLWHLVWGTGLFMERKIEQIHHRRKAGTSGSHKREMVWTMRETKGTVITPGCLHSWQLSGSSFYFCGKSFFLDGLSAPLLLKIKRAFPLSILQRLCWPTPKQCLLPGTQKGGRRGKPLFQMPRWEVAALISRFSAVLLSPFSTRQRSGQANKPGSLQSPRLNWSGKEHLNMLLNPGALLALWKATLQRSKFLN